MIMKKYFSYLRTVLRHEWFVLLEAYKLGILWRGLMHDLSKLRPDEFIPYVKYFSYEYGTQTEGVKRAFDIAWLKHQHRNKHHWQYWVLANDNDGRYALSMPDQYRLEMLADWRGAGCEYGNPNIGQWYQKTKGSGRLLHPETRQLVEDQVVIWIADSDEGHGY